MSGAAGTVNAIWDTTSKTTTMPTGNILSFYFVAKTLPASATAGFTLTVNELFNSARANVSWNSTDTIATSVTVNVAAISDQDLGTFRKLQTIRYPDSLSDIAAAESLFASYSTIKATVFRTAYPTEYGWFSNARNEYNRLAANATLAALDAEVNKYLTDYASVLALTGDTVSSSDKPKLNDAIKAFDILSSNAKSRVGGSARLNGLEALVEKIEFIDQYSLLWTLTANDVAEGIEDVPTYLSGAFMIYDTLSDGAKAILTAQKEKMDQLQAEVERVLANNETEKKILEQVAAFQKRWLPILTLSEDDVTISDQRAIELMLTDAKALPDNVRQRLASYIANGELLLDVIKSIETQFPGDTSEPDGSSQAENEEPQSQPGVVNNNTNTDGGNKVSATVIVKQIPLIIQILAIIFGAVLLLAIYPAIILFRMMSRGEYAAVRD